VSTRRPTAFLDSGVVLRLLTGGEGIEGMMSERARARVQYAVNPIVLQEVLLAHDPSRTVDLDRLREWVQVQQLDTVRADELIERQRYLRNAAVHSNDLLILAGAQSCDFLVTFDVQLAKLAQESGLRVVQPADLLAAVGAA
jgi:predicted nucleic acid-binding protein